MLGQSPEATLKRTIETETVALTSSGFQPSRLERPPGKFRLFVQSTGALGAVTLQLENEGKAALKAKGLSKAARQRWIEDHSLPSGKYTLRVKEHPKFALQIVIR